MLEKIGLPGKPSLRGNNWVVDSSHCQGCSSQFTFINRKHHCRRCGGLFCNSCTVQRMVLRGQGDSPVRICEPCKKLEEAARFEKRYGHKNVVGRGDSKQSSKNEDELPSQNYDGNGKDSLLSRRESNYNPVSNFERASSSASYSNNEDVLTQNKGEGTLKSREDPNRETKSVSPVELRQQALNEKTKYKLLKVEGKSEEALKAFKRGKELEREAAALEINLRRDRKKALSINNTMEVQNVKYDPKDSEKKVNNRTPQTRKDKDDLAAELKELGWSDMDLHEVDKKPANVSLEGELSSLIRESSQQSNKHSSVAPVIDKTEVLALKKKALALKREGKLGEAKEELKKAKILEKQLEEQELLAEGEDSDDELSLLIRNMDNDKKDDLLLSFKRPEPGFDFDNLVDIANDVVIDSNFEVTDDDMDDPEIAAALSSLGWMEDSKGAETIVPQPVQVDREALMNEIQSLKREALNQKRAGNTSDAMTLLKKAKLLEKDLDNVKSDDNMEDLEPKVASKSRILIQRELLGLKKKALTLRREGRLDEADEELRNAKVLEQQLEEMDNAKQGNNSKKQSDISIPMDLKGDVEQVDEDITDQDMNDPSYLSVLKNLGWNDEDNQVVQSKPSKQSDSLSQLPKAYSSNQVSSSIRVAGSRRSKGEIQRELLGLKRKALTLRRQGNIEEAEEVLLTAKTLEDQIAEMEAPKSDVPVETVKLIESETIESNSEINLVSLVDATKEQSVISNKVVSGTDHPITTVEQKMPASSNLTTKPLSGRDRFKLQQQSLAHKRQSLKLRREGRIEEAEAEYKLAKDLETQLEESAVNTSVAVAEPVDNVGIEDLLDPQLLSALKSVGLQNANPVSQGLERGETTQISMANTQKSNANVVAQGSQRQETAQISIANTQKSIQERIELEEQIKAEKVKAVTLKRSGKKAEALDALRRAKLLEKKLSSLDS